MAIKILKKLNLTDIKLTAFNLRHLTLNILLLLISGLYVGSALALEPFVIKDIRIEGIQRTEAGTVFSHLPVKVGETMNDDLASQAIKSLYAAGFFKDVRIEADGDVLVITVQERPSVAQIEFNGNKSLPTDKMKEGLKQMGVVEGQIFDKSQLDLAEQEIKRQYLSQSKYAATVKTIVSPLERNRVAVRFEIVEGEASKIRDINIVGNQSFTTDDLRAHLLLTTSNWMTWWNKNDQYSKQKLNADLESLRSFYMNQGYLEFNIDSTQVTISPDKRDIYITVNVTEGEKYTVSEVKLAGETLVPEEELRKLIQVQAGETFSREKLTKTTKAISDRLSKDGYAFSNINAVPEINKDLHTASFTFFVDPGKRIYVRRINIAGNTRTRDEVVRREVRQLEASWYDSTKIDRSKERLVRTQYFSDVKIETPAVAGVADQVDLNINLVEQSTGSIQVGAGLSSYEGVVLGFTVNQNNFMGTGNRVNVQVSTGKVNTTYALTYTDPYFTPDGVSRALSVYRRDVNTNSLIAVSPYSSSSYGAGISFGVPINERDAFNFGLTADLTQVNLSNTIQSSPQMLASCPTLSCNRDSLVATGGWAHDSRDSIMYPTVGVLQRITGEVSLPVTNLEYYKLQYKNVWYQPITDGITLMLNGEIGYAGSYGNTEYPFFKNFYLGGVNSVRGYDNGALGPQQYYTPTGGTQIPYSTGGTRSLLGNAELLLPVPGLKDNKQFRLSFFLDGGQVYSGGYDFSQLRYSAGMGISWVSPFGPLKLSYAKPLNNNLNDPTQGSRTQSIQFQLGQQF